MGLSVGQMQEATKQSFNEVLRETTTLLDFDKANRFKHTWDIN